MTTRKDGDKNQIVSNINYDQNSLSIFLKIINNQIKMASDKTYTEKVNLYYIRTIFRTYPQCDLVISRQEMSKRAKFNKILLFLKRKNFELIRNIMHQMKSMRDSFIPPQRAIETFICPLYKICHTTAKSTTNTGKKKKNCTKKFVRKNLHENLVPAN